MNSLNRVLLDHACRIASEIEAKALLLYADAAEDLPIAEEPKVCFNVILVTKGNEEIPAKFKDCGTRIQVPNVNLTRVGQIKIAIDHTEAEQGNLGVVKSFDYAGAITNLLVDAAGMV